MNWLLIIGCIAVGVTLLIGAILRGAAIADREYERQLIHEAIKRKRTFSTIAEL